jgi:transposase
VRERAQEVNRLQKVLDSANLKLAAVATDILGVSGRLLLEAIARGEGDPEALAELAKRKLRAKLPQLRRALEGRVKPHHRVLLRALPDHVDFLEGALEALDAEVERALAPFAPQLALLATTPGVKRTAAATLLAELGGEPGRCGRGARPAPSAVRTHAPAGADRPPCAAGACLRRVPHPRP